MSFCLVTGIVFFFWLAKLQQKNDIRKNVHHFCGIFPVSLFRPSAANTDRTKTCFRGFSMAH